MSAFGLALAVLFGGFGIYDGARGNYVSLIFDAAAFTWMAAILWRQHTGKEAA